MKYNASEMPKRVLELDGLRAFAILFVLLAHLDVPGFAHGWIGVDLFFVLSGYLITGILVDSRGNDHYYRTFIVRRALRILPLYYTVLAAITIYARLQPDQWSGLLAWGSPNWFTFYCGNIRAALQNAWPPTYFYNPLWSLQVEEQFYLLYPAVVALCSRRGLRNVLIGCVAAAPVLRGVSLLLWPQNRIAPYVLTPCRMDALALGGLVAIAARSDARPPRWWLRAGLVTAGGVTVALFFLGRHRFTLIGYTLIGLTFAAALSVVVMAPWPAMTRLLRWGPLTYTGQIAYGLYLLHLPVYALLRPVLHGAIGSLLTLAGTFLAAGLSWRFLDRPILRLKDRFSYRTVRYCITPLRQSVESGHEARL